MGRAHLAASLTSFRSVRLPVALGRFGRLRRSFLQPSGCPLLEIQLDARNSGCIGGMNICQLESHGFKQPPHLPMLSVDVELAVVRRQAANYDVANHPEPGIR